MHVLSLVLSRSSSNGNFSERGLAKQSLEHPSCLLCRLERLYLPIIQARSPSDLSFYRTWQADIAIPKFMSDFTCRQTSLDSAKIDPCVSRWMEASVSDAVSTGSRCWNHSFFDLRHHSASARMVTPPIMTIA